MRAARYCESIGTLIVGVVYTLVVNCVLPSFFDVRDIVGWTL